MKVLIAVNSLVQGGAQRFSVHLADELFHLGHEVEILSLYPEDTDFFVVNQKIPITRFIYPFQDRNRKIAIRILRHPIRIIWRLKDLYEIQRFIRLSSPDLILSIESYMGVLIGCVSPKAIPLVISERVHPKYHPLNPKLSIIQKLIYKRKNVHLHAQGLEIAQYLSEKYKKEVKVLPNIVLSPNSEFLKTQNNNVLSLARYSHQKGIDLLLEAWSQVPPAIRASWNLVIYGDGDRSAFIKIVEELNIQDSVQLNGPSSSVDTLLSQSSVFILASRYEGFPNALAEAMAHGVPSIATDCPSAIRELTLNGTLARLTPVTPEGIKDAIIEFITSDHKRKVMGEKAKKVTKVFDKSQVVGEWIAYFRSLVKP